MIRVAEFVSDWDDGVLVCTECRINTETHEIIRINMVDAPDVDILNRQYIVIDGREYPAVCTSDMENGTNDSDVVYWYN